MNTVRRVATGGILGLAALTLASCSEPAAPEAGGNGDGASGTLTVYTSEPQAKIDALNAEFTAENPGIDVQVFRAGTGDLNARIASERQTGSIGADVLLAADAPTFEKYKADDLLLQYTPADVDALDPNVVDPDGYYVGTRIIPTVIAYNTGTVSAPPTSWKELADPQYKGRITLPNPDVSGAAAFNTAVWLGQDDLGLPWLTDLVANEPVVAESNGPRRSGRRRRYSARRHRRRLPGARAGRQGIAHRRVVPHRRRSVHLPARRDLRGFRQSRSGPEVRGLPGQQARSGNRCGAAVPAGPVRCRHARGHTPRSTRSNC